MADNETKTFTAGAVLIWQPTTPTLELTFGDLILEVAEYGGIAYYGVGSDEVAQVPADTHDLALCKRIVNKAIRMFIADSPPNGWRWMRKTANILLSPDGDGAYNIDRDPSRYLMPLFFHGQVDGPITYGPGTNTGAHIEWVDEATIRRYKSVTAQVGSPRYATIKPASIGGRWELELYPAPSAADVLLFPWTVSFDKLVDLTDTSPADMKFDQAILAACYSQAETDLDNPQKEGFIDRYRKIDLPNAIKLDGQTAPRRIGNLNQRRDPHTRSWSPVGYSDYNGNDVSV